MTTPTTFVCRRHPRVRVELFVPGSATCTHCRCLLRPVAVQPAVYAAADLEPVAHGRT